MTIRTVHIRVLIVLICLSLFSGRPSHARTIDFSLQEAVNIALENSYQIKRLELGIERSKYYLKARESGLKSKVSLTVKSPEMKALSDYKWNSTIQRDEIIREDTLRWQSDLSVRQPLIFFGYPTNGYLSLNNTLYQYNQKFEIKNDETNYYSRFFFRFDQPLLQANYLKNNLERAEIDLEQYELNFINDRAWLIDRTSYRYYNLFAMSYKNNIGEYYVKSLEKVEEIVNRISEDDSTRAIEKIQVQVELSNIREKLLENQSDLRLEMARVKQDLRIDPEDSLDVKTDADIIPVTVDLNRALQYGYNLRPTLRLHDLSRRELEIYHNETKLRGAFHLDLSFTYGLEKQDREYYGLWEDTDNSYSVSIRAYIPIWDWGRRKSNTAAVQTYLKENVIWVEESRSSIRSEITNGIKSLEEYKLRALAMQENMKVSKELSAASLKHYEENNISTQDILKTLERNMETELSFLEAYLGYKKSLIRLMVNTHYDYENQITLIDKLEKGI
jgi:outer membrane protein